MLPDQTKGKVIAWMVGILGVIFAGSRLSSVPASNILGGGQGGVAVHVSGHVAKPGLYHLSSGARIDDAIKAAGGSTDGDPESLNLAALVKDGEKITVPARDFSQPAQSFAPPEQANDVAGKISLSNGTEEELRQLPGVGPGTAAKIIEYRNAHGAFKSIDEVKNVGGIGDKKYAKLAPYLAP